MVTVQYVGSWTAADSAPQNSVPTATPTSVVQQRKHFNKVGNLDKIINKLFEAR